MSNRAKIYFALLFYACSIILVFWTPLTKGFGAIQWDAVNVHFFNLQFSSDAWHAGSFPLWTPYIFSGFPQIADLQVAIFYPINLAIAYFTIFTPQILMYQTILHYFLAGFFAFLFAWYLSKRFLFSLAGGLVYAFGGFMSGHASHVGMQNAATWFPLIFLFAILSVNRSKMIYSLLGGMFLGISILAGHFQMALYISYAIGAYFAFNIAGHIVENIKANKSLILKSLSRKIFSAAVFYLIAFLIAAIQLLPTYELVKQSQRAKITLEMSQTESLQPQSLRALVESNYNNAATGDPYVGPWDRTQNYLFLGAGIIILAGLGLILGLLSQERRKMTIFWSLLLIGSLLYSFGQFGFLQKYFYFFVPFFDKIRAPSNMMLLFNISIIALASGCIPQTDLLFREAAKKNGVWKFLGKSYVFIEAFILILISWEVLSPALSNTLLYKREGPAEITKAPPMAQRISDEYSFLGEGEKFKVFKVPGLDTNASQIFKIYAFDGYNPLSLSRYGQFTDAMVKNGNLVDLAGIKYLPCEFIPDRAGNLEKIGNICVNETYFNQAFLVKNYAATGNEKEALEKLSAVDLERTVVLEEKPADIPEKSPAENGIIPDAGESLEITEAKPGLWKIASRTETGAFLVLIQANYPGWTARIDGREAKIYQADYLFQSVFVPPGIHEITFQFKSSQLKLGAFLTIIGVLFILIALIRQPARNLATRLKNIHF